MVEVPLGCWHLRTTKRASIGGGCGMQALERAMSFEANALGIVELLQNF